MQRSPLRHPVAIVRQVIGLGQKELATLVGRSPRTIKAVELGQLKLGSDLADALARETGASLEWLIRGDVQQPAVNADGHTYSKADFDAAQGRKLLGWKEQEVKSLEGSFVQAFHLVGNALVLQAYAWRQGQQARAIGLLQRFEDELMKLFEGEPMREEFFRFLEMSKAEFHFPDGALTRLTFDELGQPISHLLIKPEAKPPPSPKPRAPRSRKDDAPPQNRAR